MKDNKIIESLHNSWLALIALLKTLYKGMPVLMITFTILILVLTEKFGNNTTFQLGTLTIVILFSSIVIYFNSKNYGEAVLALSAGLFTVYTVSWTQSLFISYIIVWVIFTMVVLLISSIRFASKIESIYIDAWFAIRDSKLSEKECKNKLEKISDSLKDSILGPIERAETIRVFSYRKISFSDMSVGLKWVNIFYSLTRIHYLTLADFVAVVIKNTSILNQSITVDMIFEHIYSGMRNASVSPQEYIEVFQKTRHLLIKNKTIVQYFNTLNLAFDLGISNDDMLDFFETHLI